MKKKYISLILTSLVLTPAFTQKASVKGSNNSKVVGGADSLIKPILNQVNFRMIGPATTSGRIVDIAVNPINSSEYYLAAAYGGVWKTSNAGITYKPIFDNYGTQSIGCLAIDSKIRISFG